PSTPGGNGGSSLRQRVRPVGTGVTAQKVTLSAPVLDRDEGLEQGSAPATAGLSETEAETLIANERPSAARVYRAPSARPAPKRKQRH
ncbi:MAG: hypothetical protein M3Y56_10235, partial [Armatimonadota bacterium]|nr:hypothetical protein [Armatimonadota bacterium]